MDEANKVAANHFVIKEEDEENDDKELEQKSHRGLEDNTQVDSGNGSFGDGEISNQQNTSERENSNPLPKRKDRVIINVGGIRHETYRSTLKNIPDTRLSWLCETSETGEFFFDRHPYVFANVLNYYRTGKLHCPLDVCGPLYEEELEYWGIDDQQVESCCWLTYRQHRDAQENLAAFEGVEFENDFDNEEPDLGRYGFSFTAETQPNLSWWEKYQPRIWTLMEEPYSSKLAGVIAYTSLFLIVLSVIIFCLESDKYFKTRNPEMVLFILEGICVAWFTLELLIRFIFCPKKVNFWKKIMNWIDLLAIVPFYIGLIFNNGRPNTPETELEGLMIIRLIRIFRIFKLSRHSTGLQILGHTLRASIRELLLLISFLLIGVVLFASLIYYCEKDVKDTRFTDVLSSFWWAVVTMTTVGYGDMVPSTGQGKFIGSLCAVCGVLTIALPVPVIVNNFSLYYSHAQARLKLPKKRRRVLVGAANALKSPAMVENGMSGDSQQSADSGCDNVANGRKCSLLITDEMKEIKPRRPVRRDSHLFNSCTQASTSNVNGGSTTGTGAVQYAMTKRKSMRPTVPTLPEVEGD